MPASAWSHRHTHHHVAGRQWCSPSHTSRCSRAALKLTANPVPWTQVELVSESNLFFHYQHELDLAAFEKMQVGGAQRQCGLCVCWPLGT